MMIDRRDFIASTTSLLVAPTLELFPSKCPPCATGESGIVFLIEGWSAPGDSNSTDQVWLRVGRSWRTAWR
jgi:hypothetical protein